MTRGLTPVVARARRPRVKGGLGALVMAVATLVVFQAVAVAATRPSIEVKRNDYNRDRVSDLVGVRRSDGCLARWTGNGSNGFVYAGDIGCGWEGYHFVTAVGDISRDGIGDLVAIRASDGCLARWLGTTTGGFRYVGDYTNCAFGNRQLAGVGDIDSDGIGDLVTLDIFDSGCSERYAGDGNGGFTYMGSYGCGGFIYSSLTGTDLNRDGNGDLVGMNARTNCIETWEGDGNGGFIRRREISCGWYGLMFAAGMGDINRDGIGDLVAYQEGVGCLIRWNGDGGNDLIYAGMTGCGWDAYAIT